MKGLRGRPILALNLVTILTFLFVTWPVGLTAARETPADNTHLSALPAWAVLPTAPATHRAESLPVPVKSPTGPRPLLTGGSTISGTLTVDDTWGPGVITVTGDISITAGVIITITPGTIVQMKTSDGANLGIDPARIEYLVNGTLHATGPVTFTSQSGTPSCGQWVGISFLPGSDGYLDDTTVEYGVHAVEIDTTNPISISDSTVRTNCHIPSTGNAWGAGMAVRAGTHLVTNTAVYDNWVIAASAAAWAEGSGVQIFPGAGPTVFQNCTLYDNHALSIAGDAAGGGMNVLFADPLLHHCEIFDNHVWGDGRAFGGGVNLDNSSAVIEADTFIHHNTATAHKANAYGGGVSIGQAETAVPPLPVIRDSRVTTNTLNAKDWSFGGGIGFYDLSWTQAVVIDTLIAGNQTAKDPGAGGVCGGGIGMAKGAFADRFDGNVVRQNVTSSSGGGNAYGGGICLWSGNAISVTNNLLSENRADDPISPGPSGGGIYSGGPASHLINNTIAGNRTTGDGGGVYLVDGVLWNNIVVNNTAGKDGGGVFWLGGPADYNDVWSNSCPAGCGMDYGPTGTLRPPNDIVADPLFIGFGGVAEHFHLRHDSPCIDAGTGPGPGVPNQDYDDQPRPLGVSWDIGFDEVLPFTYAKSVDLDIASGNDSLAYTIVISNPDPISPIVRGQITDVLPANTTYSSGPTCDLGTCDFDGVSNAITWSGDVSPSDVLHLDFTVTVDAGLADGTAITNSAAIAAGAFADTTNVVTTTVYNPGFTLTKSVAGLPVAGAPFTYTIIVTNTSAQVGATNVVVTDALPTGANYVSGGSVSDDIVSWTVPSITADDSASVSFAISACQTVTNAWYRVSDSDQGVDSAWGAELVTTLADATINTSFDYAPIEIAMGGTVFFTDTTTTDGGPIVEWFWGFGDRETGSGATASHTYETAGSYTVTLQVTDTCGFAASAIVPGAVVVTVPDIDVSPLALEAALAPDSITTRTLTIANLGTADLVWGVTETPDVPWLSLPGGVAVATGVTPPQGSDDVAVTFYSTGLSDGVYTTKLTVNSNDPDEPQINVSVTLTVTAAAVYGVNVTAADTALSGYVGQVVTYTLTVTNAGNVDDRFTVDLDPNGWPATASAMSFGPLPPDETYILEIYVTIPAGATEGMTNDLTVTITSVGDTSASDSVTLTTTAIWRKFYLPVVFRSL